MFKQNTNRRLGYALRFTQHQLVEVGFRSSNQPTNNCIYSESLIDMLGSLENNFPKQEICIS